MNRRYRLTNFTALLAALFLALGPALAPVLAASPKTRTIEICTAFGMIEMALGGDYVAPGQETPPQDHGDPSGHCVFCNLRNFAVNPTVTTVLAPLAFHYTILSAATQIIASVRVSGNAGPRGPPRFL